MMPCAAFFDHWFWLLLTAAALIWYSTVTVYVAVRGALDIKSMLRRLRQAAQRPEDHQGPGAGPAGR